MQSHEVTVIIRMVLEPKLHLLEVVQVRVDKLIPKAKPLKVRKHRGKLFLLAV